MVAWTPEQIERSINTKEDAEVINALYLGNAIHEQRSTVRLVGLSRLFDML
jgi:hypothetical protein